MFLNLLLIQSLVKSQVFFVDTYYYCKIHSARQILVKPLAQFNQKNKLKSVYVKCTKTAVRCNSFTKITNNLLLLLLHNSEIWYTIIC